MNVSDINKRFHLSASKFRTCVLSISNYDPTNLFGKPSAYIDEDPLEQDVIRSKLTARKQRRRKTILGGRPGGVINVHQDLLPLTQIGPRASQGLRLRKCRLRNRACTQQFYFVVLKTKSIVFDSLGPIVISIVCSVPPKPSCQATMVYRPGGKPSMV
jgi:hypothetical protein